jgi:23S rRNA (guanosine2251-2'-O)-methyltransferase
MMTEEMIIGKNPVLHALQSGRSVNKVMVSEQINRQTERELHRAAKKANTILQKVPKRKLDQLSKGRHQGIIAYVAPYEYASIEAIFARATQKQEMPFLLILDELEDPHNLGAIIRTADATGVHGLIIPKHRAVGLTETVAKASAGAIEHVPVARVTNIAQTMDLLKQQGMWIIGTDEQGAKDYRTIEGDMPLALVIGNEGKGMTRLVKDKCDFMVSLPMHGNIPSLNASVAAGLLMYEVHRKRNPLGET